jgi:undecaprenyl-diphosphatase
MGETDAVSADLSWLEAAVIGFLQGVSELFPVSSLGHSVLIPAIVGGSWAKDLNVSAPESPYLAFIVGLHVATAIGLLVYFWRDWLRIIGGLITSIRYRRVSTPDERLAWLLILATIPIGIAGLALEHLFRTTFSKPNLTAVFLMLNGLVLLAAERFRRRDDAPAPETVPALAMAATAGGGVHSDPVLTQNSDLDTSISRIPFWRAIGIGASQILALLPGISRSGIAMSTGLWRGMGHREAARFSFLLATPVIFAAGALKIPDLMGPLGDGIRPQMLLGSVLAGVGAYVSVRFLERYFVNNSLRPFGYYCLAVGLFALLWINLV